MSVVGVLLANYLLMRIMFPGAAAPVTVPYCLVPDSARRYSVMSGLLPLRVKYAHAHWVITVTRLRKPMSRKT